MAPPAKGWPGPSDDDDGDDDNDGDDNDNDGDDSDHGDDDDDDDRYVERLEPEGEWEESMRRRKWFPIRSTNIIIIIIIMRMLSFPVTLLTSCQVSFICCNWLRKD